uniref:Aminopeptidase O (putative) n=1 Tax=Cairina moschata TaxID=8855 RepID=A0A8C3CX25_CAIMO
MEPQLDPMKDDLPLMANTSHMLVKHYVLDLDVDFKSQVIEGFIVLFLETGSRYRRASSTGEEGCQSQFDETCKIRASEQGHVPVSNESACSSKMEYNDFAVCGKGGKDTSDKNGNHSNEEQASGISSSKNCCDIENHGNEDFLLVLDCCDLSVLKVEEVDVAAVSGIEKFTRSAKLTDVSKELANLRNQIVHELVTLPSDRWKEQLYYYTCCSQAPGCGALLFATGTWSLEIRKSGIQTPADFPHAIRIRYKTKPEGRSVTWTTDQSGSPHIIFLSQSVLPGGRQLCGTRLCHEIAHAWFGLAIGARDWTEEWISEGFATFLEDVFWARAQQLSHDEEKAQQELKALLRWRRLRDEVQNSEEELQVLRSGLTVESIFTNWLDTSGIPKPLLEEGETWKESRLVQQVSGEVTKWIRTNQRIRKSGKKKRRQNEGTFQKLLPDQLVLLLEYLLEEKTLCPRTLQGLEKTYQLRDQDAEVRHRWCELVVKHKYVPAYGDVEKFLREDQAMGVYLYGELMVNEDAKQQELAYKCFAAAREQMDASSAKVVAEMLF